MANTQQVQPVAIVPGAEWDRITTGERVTIKRITSTHVQYNERGVTYSSFIDVFLKEYRPAPRTVRAQSGARKEPPLPPAARPKPTLVVRPAPVEAVPDRNEVESPGVDDKIERLVGTNGNVPGHGELLEAQVTAMVEGTTSYPSPTEVSVTPSRDEQIVADWNHGQGLAFRDLMGKYKIGIAALKQVLIPAGWQPKENTIIREARRQKKAEELRTQSAEREAGGTQTTGEVKTLEEVGLRSEVVTFTPEVAAKWLEKVAKNRPIEGKWVDIFAGRMKRGEWRQTAEPIKLNKRGEVHDGQHRLWAVVESGASIPMMVVYGVEDDAFDVMDSGHTRSTADILALHDLSNAKRLAPAARLELTWQKYGEPILVGKVQITSPMALEFVKAHPEFETAVMVGERISRAGVPGGSSVWSAVVYRLSQVNARDTEAFVDALTTGINLSAGDPILALRNRLFGSRTRMLSNEVAAIAIKAWNMMREGRTIQLLAWKKGEPFPKPR